MRKMQRAISQDEETSINLTPLIDVVFVVLIMFIIVAPMLELDRVELATHQVQENKKMATSQEGDALIIHVHRDNSIFFNSRKVDLNELAPLLRQARERAPDRIPQVFHDKKAYFQTYQSIKDAIETAGFREMDVVLKPGDTV
jgi:biopolymer transport protein ExbD